MNGPGRRIPDLLRDAEAAQLTDASVETAAGRETKVRLGPYRPLVAAATRTGLTLLVNIARQFIPLAPHFHVSDRTVILRKLCRHLGQYVHERMMQPIRAAGLEPRLLYNGTFHPLAGGTKWLKDDRADTACIRKYIGVKGMGDFTLITSYPREVLETDDIIHSHEDPRRWFRDDYYEECTRYASVRNPVGTMNSAMFSINAITSEYIQRYVPQEQDNSAYRAKYKSFMPVHNYLLIEQGVHIGEFHHLEELAREKIYEFCYLCTTAKIKGTASGFALRPLAIK